MTSARSSCLDNMNDYLERAKRLYAEERSREDAPSDTRSAAIDWGFLADAAATEPGAGINTEMDEAWGRAARLFHEGQIVTGIVTGWNRGGLLVRWERLQGFVPASQLKTIPCAEDPAQRDEALARWVGEELSLKVIELDRTRNRLVFSERATVWGPRDGFRLLESIVPGEVQEGVVSNLCDFGAFVDLGGVDGLIHVSELSWGRITHPSEVLTIGQPLSVYVINVDRVNRRVALSLKRLHPDPWSVVEERFSVGQVLDAVVTNVVDFGAFARIDEGLEGLVHISEFTDERKEGYTRTSEMIRPGETVRVVIVRIDSANHRLGLSMRLPEDAVSDATPGGAAHNASDDVDSENVIY